MKKLLKVKLWAVLFSIAALSAVSSCGEADEVEVTIFHTNDVHSRIHPTNIDPFGLGGLARMSTLLTKLRATTPISMTLDAGDFSEGAWYFNVDGGANMLELFDAMKYDAAVVGNHDYLLGADGLINQVSRSQVPLLAANFVLKPGGQYPRLKELQKAVQPYIIKEVAGLKVGIIGITTAQLVYASYIDPFIALDPVREAQAWAKIVRPHVDLLFIISHNDLDVNMDIAKEVSGVDAVISGHTHLKTSVPIMVENAGRQVPVVEAHEWGKFLGELKLTYDKKRKYARFKSWKLYPVGPDLAEDPQIAKMVATQDEKLKQVSGMDTFEQRAESDFELGHEDGMECPEGNLMLRAMREVAGADLSLEEVSLTGIALPRGPLTNMDLHDVFPHLWNPSTGKEWTVHIWNARGKDIFTIFDVFFSNSAIGNNPKLLVPFTAPIGWLSSDGVELTWDLNALPSVKTLNIGGKPYDPNARYKVALTDGLWRGITMVNDIFHIGLDTSQFTDLGLEAWKVIADYAAAIKQIKVKDFAVGLNTRTTSADLGVYAYGMDWSDGRNLKVMVQNFGLQTSQPANLGCFSGVPNDMVLYRSAQQKWTPIGQAQVPPIEPGGQVIIQIPWNQASLIGGYWPAKCDVTMNGELYRANNEASRVFTVGRVFRRPAVRARD